VSELVMLMTAQMADLDEHNRDRPTDILERERVVSQQVALAAAALVEAQDAAILPDLREVGTFFDAGKPDDEDRALPAAYALMPQSMTSALSYLLYRLHLSRMTQIRPGRRSDQRPPRRSRLRCPAGRASGLLRTYCAIWPNLDVRPAPLTLLIVQGRHHSSTHCRLTSESRPV
jgi:hypothetical protein